MSAQGLVLAQPFTKKKASGVATGGIFFYLQPDATSFYLQPDGTSFYKQP